jgi:broad specificity phosphatase PhoE
MKIMITRHGQPVLGDLAPGLDHQYPPGDPSLTALGREQASCLGKRLRLENFRGPIFSSPYRRTLETAEVIATETGSDIFPEKAIQEFVPEGGRQFASLGGSDMAKLYPHVIADETFPHPWLFTGPEGEPEVLARVRPFINELLGTEVEEVLLVGHGASVYASIGALVPDAFQESQSQTAKHNWNCALSTIICRKNVPAKLVQTFDISHMPGDIVTSNLTFLKDVGS